METAVNRTPKVLTYGEVVWDIIGGQEFIGGAPFNVSVHLARLGAEVSFLSRVGKDRLGDAAVKMAEELGVSSGGIQRDAQHGTGCAYCTIGADGSAQYTFSDSPAHQFIEPPGEAASEKYDAFYFGLWAQYGEASRRTLRTVLENGRFDTVLLDVNIRNGFYPKDVVTESFSKATIVKLNDEEAVLLSELLYGSFESLSAFAERVRRDFAVKLVCITRGAAGHELFADGYHQELPAERVRVEDTVGAGDAFCAGLLTGWLRTGDLELAGHAAQCLGGYVASRKSALPPYQPELLEKLRSIL